MINLELYSILQNNKASLRATSKDDSDPSSIQYMTSSETDAVNFDLVKRHYTNEFGLSEDSITSVDAIIPLRDRILFIEFKMERLIIAILRIRHETVCWFFLTSSEKTLLFLAQISTLL